MRTGDVVQRVLESFRMNANHEADLLSIESTGGKEVSDRALMEASLKVPVENVLAMYGTLRKCGTYPVTI